MRVQGIVQVPGRNAYSDADGTKYGIAIHNTSNDASAADEARYAQRRDDGVSAHFYADAIQVIQSLDTTARAGHAGSSNGNQHAVAVEITGVNGWSRATWLQQVDWDELGWVLATVCRHYGIAVRRATVAEMRDNPKVKAFYSHDDMRRAWGGTDHTDPGGNFPWDRLFQAVATALGGTVPTTPAYTGGDMDYNQNAKLDALFNAHESVALDTDGTVDGKGAAGSFDVPLVKLIKQNHKDVLAALAGAPVPGEVVEGGPVELSDADVERIARRVDELLAARLAS